MSLVCILCIVALSSSIVGAVLTGDWTEIGTIPSEGFSLSMSATSGIAATDQNIIAAGVPRLDTVAIFRGSDTDAFTQEFSITDATPNSELGHSVSVDYTHYYVLVGSPGKAGASRGAGSARVFRRNNDGSWSPLYNEIVN